jgi:segregation and condensation protein A
MAYEVKLEAFEGPLDLLLHLIRKNEIDINHIPIALITAQYLRYLDVMRALNLDLAGEYLVVAATLIHIKSKMLLPVPEPEDDGEEEADPREELVRQLLEYQRFKEAAAQLQERPLLERDVFTRPPGDTAPAPEERLIEVGLFELIDAFRHLMEDRWRPDMEIAGESVSLEEVMAEMLAGLRAGGPQRFTDLLARLGEGGATVVAFLALLELVKQGLARVYQVRPFGAIRVSPVARA